MQIELTDEIIEAINSALMDGIPCIVATVGDDNMPNLAYKGSVIAFDREHLAFWERSSGETLTALRRIPKVAVLYRNPATRLSWRIYGNATLHENGTLRDKIDLAPENESRPNVSNQGFWTGERGQKDWAGSVANFRTTVLYGTDDQGGNKSPAGICFAVENLTGHAITTGDSQNPWSHDALPRPPPLVPASR